MKTISIIGMLSVCSILQAQTSNPATAAIPSPRVNYIIGQQGANSRVWQKIVKTVDAQGNTALVTNQAYVELSSGLNFWRNGQWNASAEDIDISPDGSAAAATNCPHQIFFPGNINNGVIRLILPGGQTIESQPTGLAYFDGSNSVLLATVKSSTGAILPLGNQVIYTNAFSGLDADLIYLNTKAGVEQNVVLRAQPPDPLALGLNPATTRLQVITEFIVSPQPGVTARTVRTDAGNLENDALNFGTMQMGQGRAFLIGTNSPSVGVDKRWLTIQGRQFLIEEVPIVSIAKAIDSLPPFIGQAGVGPKPVVSKNLVLPPQRLTRTSPKTLFLAKAEPPGRGLVLDYQILNSSLTNFTFQGDTTYYISGLVYLYGTNNILEGGAVLKFATNNTAGVEIDTAGAFNCQTAPYRPAILTAIDDNSVGQAITNSTGNPTNYYGSFGLEWYNSATLHDLRLDYLYTGLQTGMVTNTIRDVQFVNCYYNFVYGSSSTETLLQNVLVQGGVQAIYDIAGGNGLNLCVNCTFHNVGDLGDNALMTNCLVVGVGNTNYSLSGVDNVFLNSDIGVFQTVGAGGNYLATNCPTGIRNAGTTNIDPALLADLQTKTTYPPIVYSNLTITTNLTLSPKAQRDTDTPDIGYHYAPIDYLVDTLAITNALLSITNGTVIASDDTDTGIWLQDGSSIVSIGTPLTPNWFVHYSSVQEQSVAIGAFSNSLNSIMFINPYHISNTVQSGVFQFSKFAIPAGGGTYYFCETGNWTYGNLLIQNCEFWNDESYFPGATSMVATVKNALFDRSTISATGAAGLTNFSLSFSNNLFFDTSVTITPRGNTNLWSAFNNDFDSSTVRSGVGGVSNGYNAYLNCTTYLNPTNATDIFQTNSLAYQSGPLGTFYQPTSSPLIRMGSTTADQVGFYHYTVTTNEVVEGTNTVSIGYHYVAVNQYGKPLDSNGDGIPDYIEDANGDGLVDNGEMPWTWTPPVITQNPTNQAVPVGGRVTFSVGVSGTGPFNYQWQLNGTNLPNDIITTVAGNGTNGFFGDNGAATNAELSGPGGVIVDTSGNWFIADIYNNRIRKVGTNGIITTVAGSSSTGGYSGDNSWATNAQMNDAYDVAVDASGDLFIADTYNFRIRKVGTNGIITTVAGNGTNGYSGDNGWATNAELNDPDSVAVDSSGNLFIADIYNNRVRKVGTNGIITTVAGNGTNGYSGDNGWATNAELNDIVDVKVDASGNLFLADYYNNRIRKVGTNGIITTVAGNGTNGYSGDNGWATNAELNEPASVVVDAAGNLFIGDIGEHVRKVDTNGYITTVAGDGVQGYNGDGGTATNAMLNYPTGVAVDASGNLLIADMENWRVREVALFASYPTLTLNNVTTNSMGNYTVVITSPYGSVTSSPPAMLTVGTPPVITQNPTNQVVFPGSNVTFSATATGTTPLNYQWYFNGINLIGATNSSLNITNVQLPNFGNYYVTVSNFAGGATSSNATLSLLGPALIVQQPVNPVVPLWSNTTFTVQATGTAPLYYQWLKNGSILTNGATVSGANTSALTLTGLQPWSQGLYSVVVSNSLGKVTSLYAIRVLSPSIAVGWGDNTYGQISGPSGLVNVAAVADANYYSLTLAASGSVFGWGRVLGHEYISATLNGISGAYNNGDTLAPGASLSLSNKIMGCILSAVDGNNNAITTWPPAPVGAQNAQQFTLTFPDNFEFFATSTYGCHNGNYEFYGGGPVVAPNNAITIGGVSSTVNSVNLYPDLTVASLVCYPNQNSTYGQTISGTVNVPANGGLPVPASGGNFYVCGSENGYYSLTSSTAGTASFSGASPSTYPHGYIAAQPNYFTLTLSQNFSGKVGDTLQVGSALMTVTSTNGNMVTCQMQNNNVQGQAIPCNYSTAIIPTSAQILMDNSVNGSLAIVATYPLNDGAVPVPNVNANYPITFSMVFPNSGVPASGIVPSPAPNVIQPYTVVQVANPSGSGVAGSGDLLYVSVVNLSSNNVGQVNIPADATNVVAIAASPNSIGYDDFDLALKNNGTVEAWDSAGLLAVPSGVTNVVAIAAGDRHSVALRSDGSVVAWGDNTYGQTNVPANVTNVVAIAASTDYSLALRSNGTVVAWGYNIQTNVPSNVTNVVAIAAGYYHCLALKSNGTVVAWNAWSTGVPSVTNVPATLTNVVAIAAGNAYSLALESNGMLVAWGNNVGTNIPAGLTNVATIAAGNYDSMAIMVSVPPLITQQPTNFTANLGGSAHFSVTATSITPISYQWLFDGTNLIGATNASLILNNIQTINVGTYSVVATNLAGSVTSSNAMLTVLTPPIITQQPTSSGAIVGGNATLSVVISGNSTTPLSYQWLFNGTNLIGATSAVLTLNNVQTTNSGTYCVVVTNVAGSVTSVSVPFTVIPVSWFQQYWGANYQTNANAGIYADPDGDGLANLGEYLAGTNPTNYDQLMLGCWQFDTNNWIGNQGQLPVNQTGLISALVPGVETNAVDMTGPAYSKLLSYKFAETDGNLNIALQSGSVIFWFKPSWSGSNEGGAGPGSIGRLINIGTWTTNATNGVWMINLDASGDLIRMDVQDNAGHEVQTSYVSIPGGMASNQWVQIAVTYTPTNTAFYVDGALAGTSGGLNNIGPPQGILTNGFDIGTDAQGGEMSQGAFDLLQTFNYSLTATAVLTNFQSVFTSYPNADPDGDGIPNAWESILGLNPLVNDATQSGSRANYTYTLADWLYQVSGIRSGSINLDNEGNVLSVSQ